MVGHVWSSVALLASLWYHAKAAPTWPSAVDELEDIMLLNTGYRARNFAGPVTPCESSPGNGRVSTAEWLRTAFHDMAPANVYFSTGGLDASIIFELGGDNPGPGFPTTLGGFVPFLTTRSSMADLIAMGVYASVRSCGGPIIPVKTGRVDATEAGQQGVPQPQNSVGTFQNQFLRMGYSSTEMIQFIACGHTMGNVKASNFPQIVPPGSAPPNDVVAFDPTPAFDEQIASRYIAGTSTDPLVSGPCVASTRCSDDKVFKSDNNRTIAGMANPATFRSKCQTLLQRMIDTVPGGVVLTDAIVPYDVKPTAIQLTLLDGGSKLQFAGEIRVRTTTRAASQIASVQLLYTGGSTVATLKDAASGFDDSFTFYAFSTQFLTSSSVTSFTVRITRVGGATENYNNNGGGFPVQDTVIFQSPQSCLSGSNLTVVAAVRNTQSPSSVDLTVTTKVPRDGLPVPSLVSTTVSMVQQSTIGPYTLYSGSFMLNGQAGNNKFDVSIGSGTGRIADAFKNTADLGTVCLPLSSTGPNTTSFSTSASSTSSSSTSSTASSTSSAPTTTAANYAYEGCFTDMGNPRALSGASSSNANMNIDLCATSCSKFQFFGVEYGKECYCGNTRDASSTQAPDSDCSFNCPGNAQQKCGAGSRLSTYRNLQYVPYSPPSIPGYTYQGCYNEVSGRALAGTGTASDTMTVENCAAFCNGATYFGVEYGRECYCSASLKAGSEKQAESDCSFPCKGNSSQFCGAGGRFNLWLKGSTTSSSSSSSSTSSSSSSSGSSSSLSSSSVSSSSSSVSPTTSSSTTSSATSSSSSSSVSSSTSSSSSSSSISSSTSSSVSSSSSATSSSASSSTPSSTSTSATSTPTPTFTDYTYQGCFVDAGNPRVLSSKGTSTSTMSYSTCATFCTDYNYFGIEYGSECYCGNSLATPTNIAPDSQCSFACSGDNTQKCGAGNRMTIFKRNNPVATPANPTIPGYFYAGCYTDSGPRTLGAKSYADGTGMTIQSCASFCAGFKYFGTEYARECYCGDSFGNAAAAKVSDSDCSQLCTGNRLQYCGAGQRLTIYQANP
ncbi:MAG: hypothetical protein M1814_003198 [Vezdaea aestivalis]|nr:MAG: hypothetical protein M1814_003198 [Vezdaea aestivalis]